MPLLIGSGLLIAIDQVTKFLVRSHVAVETIWSPWSWLSPYARVFRTQNTGMAFSMLPGFSWLFTVFAIGISAAIIYYFPRIARQDWLIRAGMILLLGGAVGNLIDRLFLGQVTDFISVGSFAIFNVADACVDVGVGVMLLGVYLGDRRDKTITS